MGRLLNFSKTLRLGKGQDANYPPLCTLMEPSTLTLFNPCKKHKISQRLSGEVFFLKGAREITERVVFLTHSSMQTQVEEPGPLSLIYVS